MSRDLSFALRTSRAGTESLMKEVRQAVWSIDPNLPLADVRTVDYYYRTSLARTSFTLLMLGVAGATGTDRNVRPPWAGFDKNRRGRRARGGR